MKIASKVNPLLTLSYMTTEHENKYFDRKSARIRVSDLAPHISGFANADGGTLVIGIRFSSITSLVPKLAVNWSKVSS